MTVPEVKEIENLRLILKDNICWTCTKEDIITNQIPDLVSLWIQKIMLNECYIEPEQFVGKLQRVCSRDCADCPYEKLIEVLK